MKGENSFERQNITPITTRPASPAASIVRRACGVTLPVSRRLGQTIASAAPTSSSSARVSVP